MNEKIIPPHIFSFDSLEEGSNKSPWFGLIQNLSYDALEKLKRIFNEHDESSEEVGLNKLEFLNAICSIFGNERYSLQSNILFDDVVVGERSTITWNDLLDFLIENLSPKSEQPVNLLVNRIECLPHMNRETIVKIVLIETERYFCYAIISKHGRIGLYDGNLNFLTSYQAIMTREDISRSEDERRRRNRWISDAIFCVDVQMMIVTNSARTIMIYEASGLNHIPFWLIISTPEIIECIAYKTSKKNGSKEEANASILFWGDRNGSVTLFKFLQPHMSLLRRKHSDKVTIFYWQELKNEKHHLKIEVKKEMHKETICQIEFYSMTNELITCSKDPNSSLVKQFFLHRNSYIFKMPKGCNCFSSSHSLKCIVTGSDDNIVRVWNSVVVSKPIAILLGHHTPTVTVEILENQNAILSYSHDGVLKLWDITSNKCFQTVKLKYPSFRIKGKTIEFGTKNIYPGPKRKAHGSPESDGNDQFRENFGITDVVKRRECVNDTYEIASNKWERSNIIVTCCNHVATINLTFENTEVEKYFEMPILSPPPLQNSVLIPSSWKIPDRTILDSERRGSQIHSIDDYVEELKFILEKDLLDADGAKSNINLKIAKLESKKLQMQVHVQKGAPYLALDVTDIEELKLSEDLPVPNRKNTKKVVGKTKTMLAEACLKDQVFSESSSSRSKSSRSSIVEFNY
ncbi:cilia- and flagella-associated protein 337 [Leptinotarsa decemlineata]|uniref:cilia- and flagella-associated protein 337 n=1 Tax=Leptinotarsa decemlineata TaxID=7539 RepID=UPI003D3081EF